MPFYISTKNLKQQAKTLVAHWPFSGFKTAYARNILSQLYGFDSSHHYSKVMRGDTSTLLPLSSETIRNNYIYSVQRLAKLGSMNHMQARTLLHKLWPAYLGNQAPLKEKLYLAHIRFYGACNDFITPELATRNLQYTFDDPPSIKDAIEALGVPHPEVGAICIDKKWVDFDARLYDGMQVEVFPNPHIPAKLKLPYKPQTETTFLLDVHLGRLARYLRMAGFDCLHDNKDHGDALLAELSANNSYILLTRDIGLLKRAKIKYARWVRNTSPEDQFKEIISYYQLHDELKPMSRCINCNGTIKNEEKSRVKNEVPEGVYNSLNTFRRCSNCSQVYWKGTHQEKIEAIIHSAKGDK